MVIELWSGVNSGPVPTDSAWAPLVCAEAESLSIQE